MTTGLYRVSFNDAEITACARVRETKARFYASAVIYLLSATRSPCSLFAT